MGREFNESLSNFGAVMGGLSERQRKAAQDELEAKYKAAQVGNLEADNSRLAGLANIKLKMDTENAVLEPVASGALSDYMAARGGPSGAGRWEKKNDTIPQIAPDLGRIMFSTASSSPAMDTSPELDRLRALDDRNSALSGMSPQQWLNQQDFAVSELPVAEKTRGRIDKLQQDEEDAAKVARDQANFDADLKVKKSKEGRLEDKSEFSVNNKEPDRYLSAKDKFETKLLASRGQLGKQNELIDRVDRDLSLIDNALDGKQPMTAQKWSELNAGLMNVIGGSISQGSLDHLTSSSVAQDAMNKLQYLSNNPQNAVDPAFIKDVRESFRRMKEVTERKREGRINAMLDGYDGILTPEHLDKLRNIGRSFTESGGDGGVGAGASVLPEDKAKRLSELRAKKAAGTLGK